MSLFLAEKSAPKIGLPVNPVCATWIPETVLAQITQQSAIFVGVYLHVDPSRRACAFSDREKWKTMTKKSWLGAALF